MCVERLIFNRPTMPSNNTEIPSLLAETVRSCSCNRDEGLARGQCGLRVNPRIPRVYHGSTQVSRLALSAECRETTTSPTPGTANLRRAIKSSTSLTPIKRGDRDTNRYAAGQVERDSVSTDARLDLPDSFEKKKKKILSSSYFIIKFLFYGLRKDKKKLVFLSFRNIVKF